MVYNFHAHTPRCHHATGSEREYIEAAISAGVKDWGFSEHIPFIFPNGRENSYRLPLVEVQDYINTINKLKVEYKDRINIYLGFEMEYYPEYFEQMVEDARSWGAEFLILGQHSVGDEPNFFFWSTEPTENEEYLKDYVSRIVAAIKSGVITYVAHPDMINYIGDEEIYEREMIKICKAAEEHNVPLEINLLGIRDNRNYPHEKFWKLLEGMNVPVVLGFDAHDVKGARDLESIPIALEICKKYNLKLADKVKLIRP